MWKNVKKGFGLAVGWTLGKALVATISNRILIRSANDEKYMDGIKDRRPDLYEKMKKFQSNKEESSVEEEEES